MEAVIHRRHTSRPRRPLPQREPLVTRRQQRVFLLLALLLLLAGLTAGVAAMLRPAPLPQFVGLWILSDTSQHGQRDAARTRDRAALIDGRYFKDMRTLPPGTPTLRQVEVQLAELQSLKRREAAVLYVAANSTLDAQGRVQLPLGSARPAPRWRCATPWSRCAIRRRGGNCWSSIWPAATTMQFGRRILAKLQRLC